MYCVVIWFLYIKKWKFQALMYDKRKRVRTDETIKTDNKLIETYA